MLPITSLGVRQALHSAFDSLLETPQGQSQDTCTLRSRAGLNPRKSKHLLGPGFIRKGVATGVPMGPAVSRARRPVLYPEVMADGSGSCAVPGHFALDTNAQDLYPEINKTARASFLCEGYRNFWLVGALKGFVSL